MKKVSLIKFMLMFQLAIDQLIGSDSTVLKFVYDDYNFMVGEGHIDKNEYCISQSIQLYDRLKSENLLVHAYVEFGDLY